MEAFEWIQRNIFTIVREKLEKAKKKQPFDAVNSDIRRFESSIMDLPENIRHVMEGELHEGKKEIDQLIQDKKTKLNNAFDSEDVKNIVSQRSERACFAAGASTREGDRRLCEGTPESVWNRLERHR